MNLTIPFLLLQIPRVDADLLVRVAIFVAILLVVWVGMRILWRFTMRLFTFGCGAILVFGLILILIRVFSQ
jgi:hypothetical protein